MSKQSPLHWVPIWGDLAGNRYTRASTACGVRLRGRRGMQSATSDEDFSCDFQGRCARCWGAWLRAKREAS